MATNAKKSTLRICKNGHKYYKSSDCPACPICEAERKPQEGFLSLLAAPARRALENKRITSLQQLSQFTEKEILALHGVGPGSLPKLNQALAAEGLLFKKKSAMNTIGYFEIQSSDPARDIKFYEALFGWRFIREEYVPIEYYRIETNSINGGLLKRPAQVPPTQSGTNAFVCSIQVEDYDKAHKLIIANGGKVALPKFAIPSRCWQGYYVDLDNNTFGIFEVDEKAGMN